ncbi:uncharacterized protein LOC123667021 [Melitaea cinxia]|uniref:uncharacterized protein LOC123667021 n=1 Tax=Melitaea cinxia TaxID=113334 RepID=UPI001E27232D|nr:uncharacterized protein LOC123667021 [Melitaea cinxia]
MEYIETKCDPFKYLGETKLLHALGLIVRDDYRGHKLGSRILAARKPLCLSQGINATATVLTGPASQISAERSGFEKNCVISLKELADQGLNYPSDENWVTNLGVMVKKWDSSCPRVWDSWEVDDTKWTIQDLPPEDENAALDILIKYFLKDEVLCRISNLLEDPVSLQSITEFWRISMSQRMCLACYNEVDGKKTLVGMNVCVVDSAEERFPTIEIEGDAWINVYKAMVYIETKCDPFKYLGETKLLHALGLIVKDDYRGHKLGSRILAARKPLALSQGLNATATVFTGPASQISAERSGFETICVVSLKELADQGLNYPSDENRVIKLMVKRFK